MDLTKILAISGKPGLYRMLSQTKTGFVVESLADGKRFPVFAHERVSSLEEISIFTTGEEDIPLKDVFRKFSETLEGKPGPDSKSDNAAVRKLFEKAIPNYDQEKVYISDMKKAIAWYSILLENNLLDFSGEEEEGKEKSAEEKPTVQPENQSSTSPDEKS
jgi:hypothetical protein